MVRPLLSALVVVCIIAAATPSIAHPPWNPYDQTRFAPITSFGPKVGVEVLTRAMNDPVTGAPIGPLLTAPLKVVTAPGLDKHVFIVDQVGKLWVVRLSDGMRTQYLDLSARLVTLGVCGPNTFDERGFLGLAFHPNFDGDKSGPGKGLFYTFTSERRDTGVATIATPGTTSANADHHNVIAEWRAAHPDKPTDPRITFSKELMRVNWPQFNHDGGDLAFGPDHEGHSAIGGYVYHGRAVPELRGKYVFGDFSLLFKFPGGPHDYGRLFSINAGSSGHGLRAISELIVLPGGSISLAVLGIGEDSDGEIYIMGNVNGVPFGNNGVVVRLVSAPEAGDDD